MTESNQRPPGGRRHEFPRRGWRGILSRAGGWLGFSGVRRWAAVPEGGWAAALREKLAEPTPSGDRRETLRHLAGTSAVAGLLTAAMVMPWAAGIGLAAKDTASAFMALPSDLEIPRPSERVLLTDVDGEPIAEVAERERDVVSLDEISPWMPKALMAIEDEHFYEHAGLDLVGTFRAAIRTAMGDTEGGSTITQQYVKNLLMEQADTEEERERAKEPTLTRKVLELRYAIEVEERRTKDEIMQGYLNLAYFGEGAHGIEVAAQRYFSVPASELTPVQAATLAGLVRAPSYYNPFTNPEAATARRNVVLDRMADIGYLEPAEAEEYKSQGLGLDKTPRGGSCFSSEQAPFCDFVMRWLRDSDALADTREEREQMLARGGITVRTTLDLDMQHAAEEAIEQYVPGGDSYKFAAEVLVEPGTGRIRAMAQNMEYGFDDEPGTTSINLAVDHADGGSLGYQAGSTFKPFTLAAALDAGLDYDTSFASPDGLTVTGLENCEGGRMQPWTVGNAGDSISGTHNMITGTKNSVNTYFAQLQKRVGLCETSEMAKQLGVHRADGEELGVWSSFTLGDQEVSPLTMASAYAVFASRGTYCEPVPVSSILIEGEDREIEVGTECDEDRLDTTVADGVNYLLQQTFKGGTTTGLEIGRPAAAKTGTTDSSAYAWFAGYTRNLVGTVVVGDIRGGEQHPLQGVTIGDRYYGIVYGATLPGPIWQATMREAVKEVPQEDFAPSPEVYGDPSAKPSGSGGDGGDAGGGDDGGGDGATGGGDGTTGGDGAPGGGDVAAGGTGGGGTGGGGTTGGDGGSTGGGGDGGGTGGGGATGGGGSQGGDGTGGGGGGAQGGGGAGQGGPPEAVIPESFGRPED